MDTVTKRAYKIRELGTKSVTLFPSRAQVVREIKDVPLAPGTNEITVVGLTPTVDEESIKVEGTGSAIITDIAIELLPNRDIFQDIYPDSDDDKSEDESETDDEVAEDKDSDALVALHNKLEIMRDDLKRAKEQIASAESRLKILDAYGKMLDRKKGVAIEDGIETYRTERDKVFQDHLAGTVKDRELTKEIAEALKEERRLVKLRQKEKDKAQKERAKIQKAKDKIKQTKARREAERRKEKLRIRREREYFWPKFCYSIRITLDAASFTPMSSRRGSVSSEAGLKAVPEKPAHNGEDVVTGNCDLSITYVTSSAFWAPSYDLQLSTTNNTGMLCFDAQLTNTTSETWANAKVTLSTSQTTFAGLEDNLPTLVPWRIKLAGRGSGIFENDVLNSREERQEQVGWEFEKRRQVALQKPRANLFGVVHAGEVAPSAEIVQNQMRDLKQQQLQVLNQNIMQSKLGASNNANSFPVQAAAAFHPSGPGGGVFGASQAQQAPQAPYQSNEILSYAHTRSAAPAQPAQQSALFAASAERSKKSKAGPARRGGGGGFFGGLNRAADEFADEDEEDDGGAEGGFRGDDADNGTLLDLQPELDFQESAIEETGMTTAYDLPGLKTLSPRSTSSKQRVARMSFTNVIFSHTVVAKYKPVAYLKAKLRNTGKLNLLKGPTGLTLDGSFMGRTTLPRCSAGDSFLLSLGIDPTVKVIYPKPDVRRSTSGIFSKEESSIYTRTVTIFNTKASAGKSISVLVLDQVPVSEDERLRVEILAPRGMTIGGNAVAAGVPGREAKDQKDWGKATALVKKGGEVSWDLSLNAGRAVKLGLEYEVALPSGEHVIQC